MERSIIHSALKKQEIQPQPLLEKYLNLLEDDIRILLLDESLQEESCPVNGERQIRETFIKMGMQYRVSQTFGSIYLSPRPSMDVLKSFYRKSTARNFWLTELWPQTKNTREEKVILPQLEWVQGFIAQYCSGNNLKMAEFLPNHWGYYLAAKEVFPDENYQMIDVLFDPASGGETITDIEMVDKAADVSSDAAFLFEALDRSVNPASVLKDVSDSLKPGGLCFITCLLSSGFEVQILGHDAEIFVPPERMNLLSFEGMNALVDKVGGFEILEFSTPGVLDIPNVTKQLDNVKNMDFFRYIFKQRQDLELVDLFQDFLQMNRLGTFGRLVLRKK